MLLRICLIIAILAGIGTIAITQLQTRKHVQGIITDRDENIAGRAAEKQRADDNWKSLVATSNSWNETKATLAQTKEELDSSKQQVAAAQSNIEKLNTDLATAIAARNTAQQELARWGQVGQTPEQMVQTIAKLKAAEEALAVLQTEKEIFTSKNRELENRLALLLGNDEPVPLPPGTKGAVVAVDPKWNFVVLNLGRDKGMLERGELLVHRDSKYIGKVRIAEVLDSRSIANVMPGTTLDEVQEGDQVLY